MHDREVFYLPSDVPLKNVVQPPAFYGRCACSLSAIRKTRRTPSMPSTFEPLIGSDASYMP